MNKKTGLILIFILGAFSIAAIIYYVFFHLDRQSEPDSADLPPLSDQVVPPVQQMDPAEDDLITIESPVNVERVEKPVGQEDVERMAKSFAERFGSFSNQSNFSNIVDLKIFMSEKMVVWADNYIKTNQKNNVASQVYYGITTKALSTVVGNFSDQKGEAKVTVQTRRREAVGSTNNSSKLYNQDILINFVKEKGMWKVDSAYWQE
jgi:hypothetical protein